VISIAVLAIMPSYLLPTLAFRHENYTSSKGCLRTDKIDGYWFDDVCKHIPLPRAVAITTFHCHNGNCESDGWKPLPKNTTDDWEWGLPCPPSHYDGDIPDCDPWWTK
jgi:hypothetical protein